MIKLTLLGLLLIPALAWGDTPPPNTVKAKMYSGDGLTPVDVTGNSINANITNTVPISGSITATNPSVSTNAAAAPASSTQIGGVDGSGNLQPLKVNGSSALKVDGSATTQPVSGTFWQAVQPVSQSGTFTCQPGNTANTTPWLATINQGGNSASVTAGNALKVDGSAATQPVSGTFWQATQPVSGVFFQSIQPVSGTVTSNIGTTNGLALDSSVNGLLTNTQLRASPVPVNGTVTANAGSGTMLVDGSAHTQPVSGTVAVSGSVAVTGPLTDAQLRATPVPVSGTVTVSNASVGANTATAPASSTQVGAVDGSGNLQALNITAGGALKTDASATTQPVSGTFWQATQPVSAAALPLPSGASTSAKQPALGTAGTSSADVITVQGRAAMTPLLTDGSGVTQPVSGTFWQATQPISAAALPLPSGAATAAKQPALGTAGTASSDVITVQGKAAMTPLLTDGSAVTQPVSGTFWQATQPVSASSLPLPSGASTSAKQPALGTAGTSSADVITVQGRAAMTPLLIDGSGTTQPVSGTFWQATQPVSAAALPLPSGASTAAKQPALGTAGSASADVITVQGKAAMTPLLVDGSGVTQPVSGTFWQATQPVSGPLTDAQLRASAVPITGSISATNPSVSATGAAIPASATMTGGFDVSNNLQAISVNTFGSINAMATTILSEGSYPSVAPATAVLVGGIDPNSGVMEPIVTDGDGYLLTTLHGGPVATNGASAPTSSIQIGGYDNGGLLQAVSVDSSGAVRVDGSDFTQPVSGVGTFTVDGSGVTQPVSFAAQVTNGGPAPNSSVLMAGQFSGTTTQTPLNVDAVGYLNVNVAPGATIGVTGTVGISGNVATTAADGSNVTLGAKADAKSTATDTTAISIMSVLKEISAMVQAPPSQAVTNAGTFSVQATAASGAYSSGSIADGAMVTIGAKADAKSTVTDTTAITIMQVLKEISFMEQTPASRAVTNAGTFVTQSTLAAETTKVIGTVNIAAAQTIGISAGSAVMGHVIADTGSTTAVTGNVATTVADGANVVLGSKADAKSTATDTTSITIMQVLKEISAMEQAPATRAVTNAGTFATQATVASGGIASGAVASGAYASGAYAAGSIAAGAVAAGATSFVKLEDVASADGDAGVPAMAIRKATPANTSGTDGDYEMLQMSAGRLWASTILEAGTQVIGHVINDASSAVIGHVIADSGSTTAVTGNVAVTIADAADVTLGAKADAKSTATDTTAVTIMQVLKEISAMAQAPAALPANQSTNTAQINGVTPLMGNGATGTGALRVSIANDSTGVVQPGNTANTTPWIFTINDGTNSAKVTAASTAAVAADKSLVVSQSPNGGNPCQNPSATLASISGSTSGTSAVQIIALSGSTKIYICSMSIVGVSGTTPAFGLVQGTGSNCVTGQTTVVPAFTTTAGVLYSFVTPVFVGTAGAELCYKDTGTTPVQNYTITYVQQ